MNKKMCTVETENHSSWGMEQHHSERAASATVFMIGDDEEATIAMTAVVAIGYVMELICVFVGVLQRTKKKDVHSSEERSMAENWKFRWLPNCSSLLFYWLQTVRVMDWTLVPLES